jgi:NAD(P)-dependent dehydrogenase (short-subunit alcohol dehydrogenase family)
LLRLRTREGASVVVADRDGTKAEEVALEARVNGYRATPVTADVTRASDVERIAGRVQDQMS